MSTRISDVSPSLVAPESGLIETIRLEVTWLETGAGIVEANVADANIPNLVRLAGLQGVKDRSERANRLRTFLDETLKQLPVMAANAQRVALGIGVSGPSHNERLRKWDEESHRRGEGSRGSFMRKENREKFRSAFLGLLEGLSQQESGASSEICPGLDLIDEEHTWIFNDAARLTDYYVWRKFYATEERQWTFPIHMYYMEDRGNRHAIEIEALYGHTEVRYDFQAATHYAFMKLPELSAGAIHSIFYHARVNSDEPCTQLMLTAPKESTSTSVNVRFPASMVPISLWEFRNVESLMATHRDECRRTGRKFDSTGRWLRMDWSGMQRGLVTGINWDWPKA